MKKRKTWDLEWWNAQVPKGTEVLYWPVWPKDDILREEKARRTKTRSRAWTLGDGSPVVLIEGQAGGVAIGHCASRCCDGSLGCFRCSGRGWDRPPAAAEFLLKPPIRYPECEKLKAISDKSQVVGEFLGWLREEKDVILARWPDDPETDMLLPFSYNTNGLLAEYFEIDLDKVEEEKRALLEELRAAQDR